MLIGGKDWRTQLLFISTSDLTNMMQTTRSKQIKLLMYSVANKQDNIGSGFKFHVNAPVTWNVT